MKLMQLNYANASRAIFLVLICSSSIVAQNVRVDVVKNLTRIPRTCVSVVPAAIEGTVDVPALVKESICKGSGDMLADFTYLTDSVTREKSKKGEEKVERITYEVFIPTVKSGGRTRGVLVVTSRNQVPVPPAQLEKDRMKAAERIEKEEAESARETPAKPEVNSTPATGMLPLGGYGVTSNSRSAFGVRRGGVTLGISTFLRNCDLTLVRRENIDGRETLIFGFRPRPDAQFSENEKYITQLKGEIWIDSLDRIVTRLAGWPANTPAEQPPAVYVEMVRLPRYSIWLPQVRRINGADYPTLFDGIKTDSTSTYTNYIRFSTEINDVKVDTPSNF